MNRESLQSRQGLIKSTDAHQVGDSSVSGEVADGGRLGRDEPRQAKRRKWQGRGQLGRAFKEHDLSVRRLSEAVGERIPCTFS